MIKRGLCHLQDRHCRALWQAAGDAKRHHEKMEVTGRCFGKLIIWQPLDIRYACHDRDSPFCVVVAATCRHVMPLKAVNLIRSGERYGYSHYLLTDIFYDMNVRFFHQDIACKHQPWRRRVQQSVLSSANQGVQDSAAFARIQRTLEAAHSSVDVLPDMHGLLHAWPCQVPMTPDMS